MVCVLLVACSFGAANGQTNASAQPGAAALPPVPVGISDYDVELFGRFAWRWRQPDGTNVVQYEGDFALHMGPRRLSSRDAVIWIWQEQWQDVTYLALEVFLWRDAKVVESGGTVSTGPMLIVTLRSSGSLQLNADATSTAPAVDSALYRRAEQARTSAEQEAERRGETRPPEAPGPVDVLPVEPEAEAPPRAVQPVGFTAEQLTVSDYQGEPIVLATGDVYVWQGAAEAGDFLEARADSAVIYLGRRAAAALEGEPSPQRQPDLSPEPEPPPPEPPTDRQGAAPLGDALGVAGGVMRQQTEDIVKGVYLAGDVVLWRGQRMVRASELYYDFEHERALILDAVMRVIEPERMVPIYIRARQARQLSANEYEARKATISSSEFHTPHYYVGADRIRFTDKTPRDETGQVVGLEAGDYKIHHGVLAVEKVPLLYWPYSAGQFKRGESALRRARFSYSDDYGITGQTRWQLFNLMGLLEPEGFDSTLRLDYYGRRGPAVGIESDYEREDYFGLMRSYYIYDQGEDTLSRGREIVPDDENRGRLLWRHRHILPRGWEVTTELSYICDHTFLEEYFESEFDEGKDQETLIYLKKQQDNWAVTSLLNWRILDFYTQTEHLPDVEFRWLGQPLGDFAVLFNESRFGLVRYRPEERPILDSLRHDLSYPTDLIARSLPWGRTAATDVTTRGDTRAELDFPLTLGPLRVVPFGSARGSYWDGAPGIDGAAFRGFFSYGARGSMYFSRVFDEVESRLLDLHRLRHEIKPDVTFWFSHTNVDSHQLTPFDRGIETLDDFDGVTVGLRQRWQTKRGGPGERRTVDWLTLDLETGFFNNAHPGVPTHGDAFYSRPETSLARNFVNGNVIWRMSDSTALLYDFNWDVNDCQMDVQNISLAVERTPRLSYFLGWRTIDATNSNLLGVGANYRISDKHAFAVREFFDIDRGETEEFAITYLRKFPRLYVALTFELDETEGESIVSIAAWPEGLPEATIGSRRYTGLATSTGIRP